MMDSSASNEKRCDVVVVAAAAAAVVVTIGVESVDDEGSIPSSSSVVKTDIPLNPACC